MYEINIDCTGGTVMIYGFNEDRSKAQLDDRLTVEHGELNKTFNELKAMLLDGKNPFIMDEFQDGNDYSLKRLELTHMQYDNGTYFAFFTSSVRGNQVTSVVFYNSDPNSVMLLD